MIIVLKSGASDADVADVEGRIRAMGYTPHTIHGELRNVIGAIGDDRGKERLRALESLECVESVTPILQPFKLASREVRPESSTVVVEGDPGIGAPSGGPGGSARYVPEGPQAARIEVDAARPSIVVIRTVYDPGWHAEVDGHRVGILPADSMLQSVPVSAGRHVIRLTYDDPSIGFGLLGSALSLLGMVGLVLALRARERGAAARATPDE